MMSIEVQADKRLGYVTKGQMLDLVAQATAAGAPDDAQVAFDAVVEFRTPIRARRAVIAWDPKDSTLNARTNETANPS